MNPLVEIIRGYKLKLWAKRLGFSEDFQNSIKIYAYYYVPLIIPVDELSSYVIVMEGTDSAMFEISNSTLNLLIEKFEIGDD